MKPILIGLLVPNWADKKKHLELHQPYNKSNLELFAFSRKDISWKNRRIHGLHQQDGEFRDKSFPFPDAVYNRCYNRKKNRFFIRLEKAIGKNKCFNAVNRFEKWAVYNSLSTAGLVDYLPETQIYTEKELMAMLEAYRQVFVKASLGYKGTEVYRLELEPNGNVYISFHTMVRRLLCKQGDSLDAKLADYLSPDKQYLVQQGIESANIDRHLFDIRVLVQKDGRGQWAVSSSVCRLALKYFYNTSQIRAIYEIETLASKHFSPAFLNTLNTTSLAVARVLELNYGLLGELSVDFILDRADKLWLIEVNGFPQKRLYKGIKDFRHAEAVFGRPLEYASYLARNFTD